MPPSKDTGWIGQIGTHGPLTLCLQKTHCATKDTRRLKMKAQKNISCKLKKKTCHVYKSKTLSMELGVCFFFVFRTLYPTSILLFKLFSGCSVILARKAEFVLVLSWKCQQREKHSLETHSLVMQKLTRKKNEVNHTSATRLMRQIKFYYSGRQQKEMLPW